MQRKLLPSPASWLDPLCQRLIYFLNILNIYTVLTMFKESFIIYSPLWCSMTLFFRWNTKTDFLTRISLIMWKQLPLQNGNPYLFNLWGVQIKRGCLRKKPVWVSPSSFLLFLRFYGLWFILTSFRAGQIESRNG